jgi:hypothetical protein
MEPLIPLVPAASATWSSSMTDALSGVVLLASVAVLGATVAERGVPRLSVVRGMYVSGAGLLVGVALLGCLSRGGLTLSCLGLLVGLEAVAVAFGRLPSLQSYAPCRATGGDPAWSAEFERGFRRHAIGGGREQNPLRRAVTRSARRRTDAPQRQPTEPKQSAPGRRRS